MKKSKQIWLCAEKNEYIEMITVSSLLEKQKDLTIKGLLDIYKDYKVRMLIA